MKAKRKQQVFHINRARWPCTNIGREWPMNPAITLRAKALLLIALTRYDREEITLQLLIDSSIDGKASVKHGLRELRKAGHLESFPIRGRKGQVIGTRFEFHEIPISVKRFLNSVTHSKTSTERPKIGSSVHRETENRLLGKPVSR